MIKIQQDLEREKARKYQIKSQRQAEVQATLDYKDNLKRREQVKAKFETENDMSQLKANAAMEVNREKQYKSFFNQFDQDMSKRMGQHMDAVTTMEYEKEQNRNQIEAKNEQE